MNIPERILVLKDDVEYRDPFREKAFVPKNLAPESFSLYHLDSQSIVVDREKVEGNIYYLQPVAYTLVFDSVRQRVFCAKRISGDERLQNTFCLGFGGHVNIDDLNVDSPAVYKTALRELREELEIRKKKLNLNFLGYVRDLNSSTSEHLGIIYYLDTGSVSIKEKDKFVGRWIPYQELKDNYYGKLESWSRLSLDYIYESEILHKLLNF